MVSLEKSYKLDLKDKEKEEFDYRDDLSLEDMVGRYCANEKIDSVKLKHELN